MQTVILKSFNLPLFTGLVEQNLMANNSIKMKFTPEFVQSIAMTASRSFVKMWKIKTENFIKEGEDAVLEFNDDGSMGVKVPEFEPFNLFILKGDVFKRFLGVFNDDPVEFAIEVNDEDSTANQLIITGQTKANTPIRCTFMCSDIQAMGESAPDYTPIERFLTPKEDVRSFILLKDEMDEIKKLIQTLHKSNSENSSYISIQVEVDKKLIRVKDKVFNVKFPLIKSEDQADNIPEKNLEFKMLKSDFIVSGKHSFEFFCDPTDSEDKTIMRTNYQKFEISCGFNNINTKDDSVKDTDDDITDDLDVNFDDDIEEYIEEM